MMDRERMERWQAEREESDRVWRLWLDEQDRRYHERRLAETKAFCFSIIAAISIPTIALLIYRIVILF